MNLLGSWKLVSAVCATAGVAEALLGKGKSLLELGRIEQAVSVFDNVVSRCADIAQVELQTQVAAALFAKAQILERSGHREEAIRVYEEQVRRSQHIERELPTKRSQSLWDILEHGDVERLESSIAEGLLSRARLLLKLERDGEALQTYEELWSRFSERWAAAEALRDRASIVGDSPASSMAP